jgi:hypothetical protein
VQGYIDIFFKLHIQLHIREPCGVLIIKFNSSLLLPLRREVYLFENDSLDKAFLHSLSIERKVSPHIQYLPNQHQADNPSPSHYPPYPYSSSVTKKELWCNFHKTNSHNSTHCLAIKNSHPHQTLFVEATPTEFFEQPKIIYLTNPTEVDTSLILMTTLEPNLHNVLLFTHNCQIKNDIATLILDNGSKKNLISQELFQHLQLPTTLHPNPYHLGWVQKGDPHITIDRCCIVTFAIGHFL